MSDALCTLGKRKEVDALLSRFGINARAVPKTTIRSPLLPPAFGALSYSSQLRASYMRAARHLGAASSRLHVMYDETVWAPSAEQCRGFLGEEEDDLRDVIVGGQWSDNHLEAWHYLDAEQWAAAGVPVDKLAKLTLHWVVSLPTNPRWAFDTCCLPRRPKAFTADEMLQHCALYLQEITQASGGLPPRSLAYDGAPSTRRSTASFLVWLICRVSEIMRGSRTWCRSPCLSVGGHTSGSSFAVRTPRGSSTLSATTGPIMS